MPQHHYFHPFHGRDRVFDRNAEHFDIGRRIARSFIRYNQRRGTLTPDVVSRQLRGIDQAKRDYKTVFKRDKDTVPMLQDYDGQRYEYSLCLKRLKKGGK